MNKSQNKKLELLAPAGDFTTLKTAVNAGADAVYFGLKEFSMRAGAKNFELKDFEKINEICNSSPRKVKKYVTLNTIIYNNEIKKIEKTITQLKGKADAIICWDLAVINLCKKYKIPFFVSTQASVANSESAKFYKKLGAKRIVLARECTLEQVKKISKIVDTEIFIHGAMCVAISGRCFMSQFMYGKSANRGTCLQSCRRSYIIKDSQEGKELKLKNKTILSAKDLCTLPFFGKIKNSGVVSFKIEGRNRDARYVDTVVRTYRKAIDKKLSKKEIENSIKELEKVYNKEFSSGFYFGTPTADDFSKVEHSASKEKKHFVGRIYNYLSKSQVALIKVFSRITVGDNLVVIGPKTGIVKTKVKRIECFKKSIKTTKKGMNIGIKIPKAKKNDEVYVVVGNI